jgi:hypothetical protein
VPSRRSILKSAAALSAAPLAPKIVFADGADPVALDALIIDARRREARAFGLRAREWGAPLREIEGDITNLWFHELDAKWRSDPAAIAGLTERPALFLLERLAWDHNLRVVFEAEHELDGERAVGHRVLRTGDPHLERKLAAAGPGWAGVLADSLIAGSNTSARDFSPSGAAMASRPGEPVKLYSWIIAPRPAV